MSCYLHTRTRTSTKPSLAHLPNPISPPHPNSHLTPHTPLFPKTPHPTRTSLSPQNTHSSPSPPTLFNPSLCFPHPNSPNLITNPPSTTPPPFSPLSAPPARNPFAFNPHGASSVFARYVARLDKRRNVDSCRGVSSAMAPDCVVCRTWWV